MKRIKSVAVAGVAVVGIVGGVTACGGTGSTEKTGQEQSSGWTEEQKKENNAQEGGAGDPFNDGAKDLTIKSCEIADPYGIGESTPTVDVSVTNSSAKVSDYLYEVEITNTETGDRLETQIGSASNVGPGQTVDTNSGTGEEDPIGSQSNTKSQPITCKVLSVDRTPTP